MIAFRVAQRHRANRQFARRRYDVLSTVRWISIE